MDLLKSKSIKFWAIILIIIVCFTTTLLFSALTYQSLNRNLVNQYKNESEYVLSQTLLNFQYEFSNIETFLEQLNQSLLLLNKHEGNSNDITLLLKQYQDMSPSGGRLIFGLENGGYYQANAGNFPFSYNPKEYNWYKDAISNKGEVIWTEPYLDFVSPKVIISAAKAVEGPEGILGVISLDFSLAEISHTISKSKVGEDGLVILLSSSGTMLANGDNVISNSLFGNQHFEMIKATKERHVPYEINNEKYLLHSNTIKQNGMTIVTAINEKEIRSNVIKSLLPILVAGVLCLVLFSFIAYIGTLRGVKPLKKLGTLMATVESGNYHVFARERDYKEVARLAKGFNSMIQAIKKRDRDLIISNEELKSTEERLRSKYEELKESQRILKASEEKVKQLASYDSLTGLLNRRSLLEVLYKEVENNTNQMLKAIIFLDLDNFKVINDSLGHSFGDKLIIEVAKLLNSISIKKKDVARISGDEFILLFHDLKSIEQVEWISSEIISVFDSPVVVNGKSLNISASIGVAIYPIHATTTEELLKIADMAMYRAKETGKNGFQIFDEGMKHEVEEKLKIELGIRECLKNNGFELFFQPLYNTQAKRITQVEALLRVKSSALSAFNIMQIIQTAEVTGQIIDIDKWVIRSACESIQRINHYLDEPINISINISPLHIMQQDFVRNIRDIIIDTGVFPDWIELEITETSIMKSFEVNKRKLEELKRLGISIHLDDFGTGYSSLSYLNSLPIDHLKIDKSFIDAMLQSEKERKIVETIINLAHNIGLHVVAEGVEYEEQFDMLNSYNCELIQGYYISKPANFEYITRTIKQYNEEETVKI
ncbi:EAL domain-containing protein [Lysinibacillus composti]|uniref:EAL domain-containing protein n=1 Tax=Lysinibacillus composti TaxID=720633 RepID=A0A3N9URS1_9BACI|nr:EAL domain-containing protein [Lysinibacillus composti]